MVSHVHLHLSLVALLVAGAPLPAETGLQPLVTERLSSIRAQQPERALQVTLSLEAQKSSLGLGLLDGIQEYNRITDAFGSTHVRYHQTYRGVEVFNGTILGHMDALGRVIAPHATVQEGIDLQPATLLDEANVREIVETNLPAGGRVWPVQVKRIVFPTKYQDGLKFKRDAQNILQLDPDGSVPVRHKAKPYCWGYRASAMQSTDHGLVSTEFVIDGTTGAILKKWDGMQHASSDLPSLGTGESQYNGRVSINTLQLGDSGLHTLRDTTRATKPWPDPSQLGWPEWGGVGSQTLAYDPSSASWSQTSPFTNATNTWGNGKPFAWSTDFPAHLFDAVGQTAAVDAHYSTQATWDYYEKVLGRQGGIDGLGSSVISIVHLGEATGAPLNNAGWSPSWFCMQYGDGSETGPLTALDIAAHEMSHGVMSFTANLSGDGFESAGLNEANSDIHATMVKYYCWGAGGRGNAVPDSVSAVAEGRNSWDYLWTTGPQLSKDGVTPLRWLYKPSKDGVSYDAWFDGIGIDDCHFSMGPGIRAFYFLCRGSSGDAKQETHSAYLPGGMAGIGNDKAIHIWYHGMTTKVTDAMADYHAIREAMVTSAKELYPGTGDAESAEVAAVKNAFAAVNVGAPAGGKEPLTVSFTSDPTCDLNYKKIIVWPAFISMPLPKPTVSHATDTSVTWSLGGLSYLAPLGGRLEDGDKFIGPYVARGGAFPVKATSREDPSKFAVNLVYVAQLDTDSDFDTDACDLGALAHDLFWVWKSYPAANIWGNRLGCDDVSVGLFIQGFNNAFNQ